jgi:hypothetical protein
MQVILGTSNPAAGLQLRLPLHEKRRYHDEPDYKRPLIRLSKPQLKALYEAIFDFYGRWHATEILDELIRLIEVHGAHRCQDAAKGEASLPGPLILEWTAGGTADILDGIKLPSVQIGTVNFSRVSFQDPWFREYLNGRPEYRDFFTAYASHPGLQDGLEDRPTMVCFHSHAGERWVLTDQGGQAAGLNYTNPKVLLEVIDRILQQVRHGLDWIDLGEIDLLALPLESDGDIRPLRNKILSLLDRVLEIAAPSVGLMLTPGGREETWSDIFRGRRTGLLVRDPKVLPLLLQAMTSGDPHPLNRWLERRGRIEPGLVYFNELDTQSIVNPDLRWDDDLWEKKETASRSIILALDGVSGICPKAWLSQKPLQKDMAHAFMCMVRARLSHPAFRPETPMEPLDLSPHVWALMRQNPEAGGGCLCLTNLLPTPVGLDLPEALAALIRSGGQDLLTGARLGAGDRHLELGPYDVRWYPLD